MATVLRTTARLDEAEAAMIQKLKTNGSDESRALRDLTHTDACGITDAQVIHAVIEAGLKAIEEKALEIGYTRAVEYEKSHPEIQAWRRAMRGRHLRPFMADTEQADVA